MQDWVSLSSVESASLCLSLTNVTQWTDTVVPAEERETRLNHIPPPSAAFHAYGKPGKTVVELRQVFSLVHHIKLYLNCTFWLHFPQIIIICTKMIYFQTIDTDIMT